jgi:hypothetical protein
MGALAAYPWRGFEVLVQVLQGEEQWLVETRELQALVGC